MITEGDAARTTPRNPATHVFAVNKRQHHGKYIGLRHGAEERNRFINPADLSHSSCLQSHCELDDSTSSSTVIYHPSTSGLSRFNNARCVRSQLSGVACLGRHRANAGRRFALRVLSRAFKGVRGLQDDRGHAASSCPQPRTPVPCNGPCYKSFPAEEALRQQINMAPAVSRSARDVDGQPMKACWYCLSTSNSVTRSDRSWATAAAGS